MSAGWLYFPASLIPLGASIAVPGDAWGPLLAGLVGVAATLGLGMREIIRTENVQKLRFPEAESAYRRVQHGYQQLRELGLAHPELSPPELPSRLDAQHEDACRLICEAETALTGLNNLTGGGTTRTTLSELSSRLPKHSAAIQQAGAPLATSAQDALAAAEEIASELQELAAEIRVLAADPGLQAARREPSLRGEITALRSTREAYAALVAETRELTTPPGAGPRSVGA